MAPQGTTAGLSLFWFTLPEMSDIRLALSLSEVLGVTTHFPQSPLPFSPDFVLGIGRWQEMIVSVVDLTAALQKSSPKRSRISEGMHLMVSRTIVAGRQEVIAWPILNAGKTNPPRLASQTMSPSGLANTLIRASVRIEAQTIHIVDITGLFKLAEASGINTTDTDIERC